MVEQDQTHTGERQMAAKLAVEVNELAALYIKTNCPETLERILIKQQLLKTLKELLAKSAGTSRRDS